MNACEQIGKRHHDEFLLTCLVARQTPLLISQALVVKQRVIARRLARQIVVKGLLGLSIPAALLTTSLPSAQPGIGLAAAPAAAYAVASTTAGFVGDAPLSATALDEIAASDMLSGSLDFGAPPLLHRGRRPTNIRSICAADLVRSTPSLRASPVVLHVSIVAKQGSWYKVTTASGKVGWILGGYLAVNGTAAAAPAVAAPAATTASSSADDNRQTSTCERVPALGTVRLA